MRFLSYRTAGGQSRFAATDGRSAFALAADDGPQTLVDFLLQPRSAVAAAVEAAMRHQAFLPLSEIQFLPVIERPGKIVCLGLNYAEHAREGGHPVPDYPALFLRVT